MKKLVIADREFDSRFFLGTGKFNNNKVMADAIVASGTEMVTVNFSPTSPETRTSSCCPTLRA